VACDPSRHVVRASQAIVCLRSWSRPLDHWRGPLADCLRRSIAAGDRDHAGDQWQAEAQDTPCHRRCEADGTEMGPCRAGHQLEGPELDIGSPRVHALSATHTPGTGRILEAPAVAIEASIEEAHSPGGAGVEEDGRKVEVPAHTDERMARRKPRAVGGLCRRSAGSRTAPGATPRPAIVSRKRSAWRDRSGLPPSRPACICVWPRSPWRTPERSTPRPRISRKRTGSPRPGRRGGTSSERSGWQARTGLPPRLSQHQRPPAGGHPSRSRARELLCRRPEGARVQVVHHDHRYPAAPLRLVRNGLYVAYALTKMILCAQTCRHHQT
jgi:hypothetical protein